MEINSQEWWNDEFRNNWEIGIDGKLQTTYFTCLTLAILKHEYLENLKSGKILDYGCALGESTNVLYSLNKDVYGYDFAQTALIQARDRFNHLIFLESIKWLEFSHLYISNVLEHFKNPIDDLNKLSTQIKDLIIVLVPYNQDVSIGVHVSSFKENTFNNKITGFEVVQETVIKTPNELLGGGHQILYVLKRS